MSDRPRPAARLLRPPPRPCPPLCAPADIEAKFAKSAWGQKLAKRAAKAATTDFDRYKAAVQKMKRSAQVGRRGSSWGRRCALSTDANLPGGL